MEVSWFLEYYQRYETNVEKYYLLPSGDNLRSPSKARKRFTNQKKAEIRFHYINSGNYHDTARAFDLNESTIRGIVNVKPLQGELPSRKRQIIQVQDEKQVTHLK